MSRLRTRSFRRSVVQVAAAFVALPACGTTAPGSGDWISNPPECDVNQGTGCVPVVDCADVAPEQGAPCATEGETCTYELCTSQYESATCVDGAWQLEEGPACNPPEPEFDCPEAPPQQGASCAGELVCDYDSCVSADGVSDARCVDGQWKLGFASCNPPEPEFECPVEPPSQGAPCGDPTLVCDYDSCTNASGAEEARCVDYTWEVDDQYSCNPPEPDFDCPPELPAPGTACSEWGAWCGYGDQSEISAACGEEGWTVYCTAGDEYCGLPAPGCPFERPVHGKGCEHVGETCEYGYCSGLPTTSVDCVNGTWEVENLGCELDHFVEG